MFCVDHSLDEGLIRIFALGLAFPKDGSGHYKTQTDSSIQIFRIFQVSYTHEPFSQLKWKVSYYIFQEKAKKGNIIFKLLDDNSYLKEMNGFLKRILSIGSMLFNWLKKNFS